MNPGATGSSSRKVPVASASAGDSLWGTGPRHLLLPWSDIVKRLGVLEPQCLSLSSSLPLPDWPILSKLFMSPLPYQYRESETGACLRRVCPVADDLVCLVLNRHMVTVYGFLCFSLVVPGIGVAKGSALAVPAPASLT